MLMRPCSFSQEENEQTWHSSDYSVKKDFLRSYNNHIAAMEIVAGCAKIYVLNNYQKVSDWSNLDVIVADNKKITEYYNYKPHKIRFKRPYNFIDRIDSDNKKKHNPIQSLTDVVLDTTDGDFSLKINGQHHNWIDNDSVIIIADYIEQQIK